MKNRIVAIVMALMMLTASITLGEAVPAAVSGEFTGTAKGFGGDVNVTVTLTEGEITAVTAEGAGETEGIGSVVIANFPAEIAATGSIAVDAISGATITSVAYEQCVLDAFAAYEAVKEG